MERKELKKLLDEQTDEVKRHQQILLEEFDSRLMVVAEGHGQIIEKIDKHSRKIEALMEMVAMNTETLEFIKSMLKRKVDLDEYEKLEKRVSLLERKIRTAL